MNNKSEQDGGWDGIYERVAAIQAAIERGFAPGSEERNRILKERAHALAREIEPATSAKDRLAVVTFELAGEHYAIEVSHVREVHALKELTPVPCTPPFILGIVNVRGQILTVIDFKEFVGLPKQGISDMNKVIIVRDGDMQLGILADRVDGMRLVASSDIQPSLPTLRDIRQEYLKGVTSDRLVILDALKLLYDEAIIVQQQADT
jgi:purine-binding chemotaxis protein CheW